MIKNIPVVNSVAKRGKKLIEDYNKKITKDKYTRIVLQVVYDYQKNI